MTEIAADLESKGLRLIEKKPLGKGSFGEVYLTKHTDGQKYAIKRIKIREYVEHHRYSPLHKTIIELKKEVCEFLAKFNSRYVVSYNDSWFGGPQAEYYRNLEKTEDHSKLKTKEFSSTTPITETDVPEGWLCIRMGYCQSDLRKWLNRNNTMKLRKDDLPRICEQILQGLEYIHGLNVIHRDIKPSNIFINVIEDKISVQIGDFGLSTTMKNSDQSLTSKWGPVGTLMYRSPEMWNAETINDYNCKTDIYSAGLVFLELVTLSLNTENEREKAFRLIREGSYVFPQTESCLVELIKKMTNKDFNEGNRPSAARALSELYKIYPELIKACYSMKASICKSLNKNEQSTPGAAQPSISTKIPTTTQTEQDISYLENFKKTELNPRWPISYGIKEPIKNFAGRDEEVTKLKSFYKNKINLVLVCGFGGLGKTELCRKCIDKLNKEAFFVRIFARRDKVSRVWLHGDTFESIKSSVFSIACKLGVTNDLASPSQMFKYLMELILEHSRKLVVVVDNVDVKVNEVLKVIQMLSSHKNTFTIVTSRDRMILDNAGERMELGVLSKEAARQILQNSIQNLSDSDADSLSKLVQYYPLALQQAIAYVKVQREDVLTPNYSVFDYVQEFIQKKSQMLDHKFNKYELNYASTTLVTWDITFEKLSEEAHEFLKILAFLDPNHIEVDFFKEVCIEFGYDDNGERFGIALNILRKYSLIKVEDLNISIHRLVLDVMREKVESGFAKKMFNVVGIVFENRFCRGFEDDVKLHMERITKLAYGVKFNIFVYSDIPKTPNECLFYLKSRIAYKLGKIKNHSECLELCEQVLSSNAKHNETQLFAFRALLIKSKTNPTLVIQLLEKILEPQKSTLVNDNQEIIIKLKIVLVSVIKSGIRKLELVKEIRNYYELTDESELDEFYTCLFLTTIIGEDWATRGFIYKCAGTFDYFMYLDSEYLERLLLLYKSVLGENDELTVRVKNRLAVTFYRNKEYDKSLELLEQVISSNIHEVVEKAYLTMCDIAERFNFNGYQSKANSLFEKVVKFSKIEHIVIKAKHYLADPLFGRELLRSRGLYRDVILYNGTLDCNLSALFSVEED